MKQRTRLFIDGTEVPIPVNECCTRTCDGGTNSSPLVYDGNHDGTPDLVSSDGSTITITPTDLSLNECDNPVTYALQNAISGVSLDPTSAVISIDCGIASQESCNLTILVDTVCNGTVIGTRSMNIVLTCGDCDDTQPTTHLNYDANGDDVPDTVTVDGDIITITPVEVSMGECNNAVTYVFAEDYGDGFTLDANTGVYTIDCNKITKEDCLKMLTVNTVCDGNVLYGTQTMAPTNSCKDCKATTDLDYDVNDDGTPDNVNTEFETIEVTPITVSTGNCNDDVTYAFAEDYGEAFMINETTAVVNIDCTAVSGETCGMSLQVNTLCGGKIIGTTSFNAPTSTCDDCQDNGQFNIKLDYDTNDDGAPDDVTVDGSIVTVRPVVVNEGGCGNDVTYAFAEDYGDGFTLDPSTAVYTVDCNKLVVADCSKPLVVNVICSGEVLYSVNTIAPTESCKSCRNSNTIPLDYDSNDDGVPDTVAVDGDTISVTPIQLSKNECPNDVTYELFEDYGPAFTIDNTTGVVSISCTQLNKADCNKEISVKTMCANNVIGATAFNAPTDSCASCSQNTTDLDYDSNNDGTPDTVAMNGNVVTVTPISLTTGQCISDISYELARPISGFTIDQNTAVVSIDCAQLNYNDCGVEITVNAMCTGILLQSSTFNAPTNGCHTCLGNS